MTRNEAVFNDVRRNRFEKFCRCCTLLIILICIKAISILKFRPLIRLLADKFGRHSQPEPSLFHDEAMIEYTGRH